MKFLIAALLVMSVSASVNSQNVVLSVTESWTEKPVLHKIAKKHETESAVVLSDVRRIEFRDNGKGQVESFKTIHKIVHVNDDKGIETFNKVYLPVADNGDLVDIKARTILPDGRVIEVNKSAIRDIQEGENAYKIFAMEGVEKGSEVEYYYTFKRDGGFFGREIFQGRLPVIRSSFTVVAPERLIFENKAFNVKATVADTTLPLMRSSTVAFPELDPVEEEKYAIFTANLARVEFKLSYNVSVSKTERLYTWNELAKRIYEIYAVYNEKEMKKVRSLVEDNKWDRLATEVEKIIAVESFLKKNFGTRTDLGGDDGENIEKILKTRLAGSRGMVRLFGAVYQQLGVPFQVVLTGDREEVKIEKNFENWNNCQNPVLYFPSTKKFLAPTEAALRYPWIQHNWAGSNGLFCKTTTIGTFTSAIGEIRTMPLEDYLQTSSNIDAKLNLNAAADTVIVDMKLGYSGYTGGIYRSFFAFTSAEKQKDFLKEIIKQTVQSDHIVSSSYANEQLEHSSTNKPFVISAVVKAPHLVEQAGNKVLVKIGEIIGMQVEMYQEKSRKFPMEIDYPHRLVRGIDFTIPAGYRVKNLADLNINHTYTDNGNLTMGFVSAYKLDGQNLRLDIMEEYRTIQYPLSQYEEFRKIINAAADFNKVVLVLEKTD